MKFKARIESKNKLVLDLSELFWLLHDTYEDEFDAEEFINDLGWLPQIRKKIIETLKEEYSKGCMNSSIHKERNELLIAMNAKEKEWHTDYVASLIEDNKRLHNDYWKLWHWYHDQLRDNFNFKEFPPSTEQIDFDYRKEVEKYIQTLFERGEV